MEQSSKDLFNELAQLEVACNLWAEKMGERLPADIVELLIEDKKCHMEDYTAIDHSALLHMKNRIDMIADFEQASKVYAKFLEEADRTLGIILTHASAQDIANLLPEGDCGSIKALATKNGFKNLENFFGMPQLIIFGPQPRLHH